MDARETLLAIIFARMLLLKGKMREKEILSLLDRKSKTIAFDELIFPNLKPVNISLPLGQEFRQAIIHPPERRAKKLAELEKQERGTTCREPKRIHCAVDSCPKKTNWMAEFYGRGHNFQAISNDDGAHWTPVCPACAEWAKTVRGVKIAPFWEVVTAYLTNIWNNCQPTAESPSKEEV